MLSLRRALLAASAAMALAPGPANASLLYSVTSLGNLNANVVNAFGQVGGGLPIYDAQGNQTAYHAGLYTGGTLVDLSAPGADNTYFRGLNDAGQVAITGSNSQGSRAFLYALGMFTDLGTLGGTSSSAQAINQSGQVTGDASLANGLQHAFISAGGTLTDLGTLGGSFSQGVAINGSGMVTGYSARGDSQKSDAFLYLNGAMTDLGSLGGGSFSISSGTAINASGQVAGYADLSSSERHAVLFSGGQVIDLGTSGRDSFATAINDSGQVIGSASTGSNYDYNRTSLGFLYGNGVTIQFSFGGASSTADGLNNEGQVVGSAQDGTTGYSAAFLYSGGSMYHLDGLIAASDPLAGQVSFSDAYAINDSGYILARGCAGRTCGDYLLTPVDATPVPEPMSLALLAGAALTTVAARRALRHIPPGRAIPG